ncbi:hypothetical protein CASFOL_010036 [Castilleja foliolosa]|uniref:Uncharacterized protein n=1 Tax=Castilleja foliolosa TaxID=1961234 RepID=A0ABD3DRG4_9LAMI
MTTSFIKSLAIVFLMAVLIFPPGMVTGSHHKRLINGKCKKDSDCKKCHTPHYSCGKDKQCDCCTGSDCPNTHAPTPPTHAIIKP